MAVTWVGLTFQVLHHRDGKMLRAPGLFAFVRHDVRDGPLLLFAGEAEDLAQAAGPGHPKWSEALLLGMDELHVRVPIERRIDRLQLLSRIVAREQPLLNLVDETQPSTVWWRPRRSAC